MNYVLDENGNPRAEPDVGVWAKWYESSDRRVALDVVGAFRISTVFLAIDHQFGEGLPVLYETMRFRGASSSDEESDRYSTRAEALKGHAAMVERTRTLVELGAP